TSRFFSTLAATPLPSLIRPSRMCSVPMYSWLKRCASWLASCITLRARSVNRSYIVVLHQGRCCSSRASGGLGHFMGPRGFAAVGRGVFGGWVVFVSPLRERLSFVLVLALPFWGGVEQSHLVQAPLGLVAPARVPAEGGHQQQGLHVAPVATHQPPQNLLRL